MTEIFVAAFEGALLFLKYALGLVLALGMLAAAGAIVFWLGMCLLALAIHLTEKITEKIRVRRGGGRRE